MAINLRSPYYVGNNILTNGYLCLTRLYIWESAIAKNTSLSHYTIRKSNYNATV